MGVESPWKCLRFWRNMVPHGFREIDFLGLAVSLRHVFWYDDPQFMSNIHLLPDPNSGHRCHLTPLTLTCSSGLLLIMDLSQLIFHFIHHSSSLSISCCWFRITLSGYGNWDIIVVSTPPCGRSSSVCLLSARASSILTLPSRKYTSDGSCTKRSPMLWKTLTTSKKMMPVTMFYWNRP